MRRSKNPAPITEKPEPGFVWVIKEFGCSCQEECCDGGSVFVGVAATEQLAEQHVDRLAKENHGIRMAYTDKVKVATTLKDLRPW